MPKITEEQAYNGAMARVARLGLTPLMNEVREMLTGFNLLVKEKKDANGGAAVRALIDKRFEETEGWQKKQTGGVDWTRCHVVNGTKVCLGVEVQFSARSDLLVIDVAHLRKSITEGIIDVGIILVPDDAFGRFLTDRGPRMSDAKRHVREARAEDLPLVLIAVAHDGPGEAL